MRAGQRLSATTRGGTARRTPCVRAVLNLCIGWLLMVPLSGIAVAEGAELNQAATMDPDTVDAKALVAEAIDLMRGIDNSYAEMTMLIKRPSWQRESSLKSWTRGREDALIRFMAPARDAGNALLKLGERMWTYNPKLNRSIRLPGGMMSQSWAGSDFSYSDMSRSDNWLRYYRLEHVATKFREGHKEYTIDAFPLDDAPVVWGKERLILRDDFVLLRSTYFDQDMLPVREMQTLAVAQMGGRLLATHLRMQDVETADQYTEIRYTDVSFDGAVQDRLFTVFSLQSGGREG